MRSKLRSAAAAAALCLGLAAPASAAAPADAQFKTEIDSLLKNLDPGTQGIVRWEGADRIDLRRDGDVDIADFANARISLGAPGGAGDRMQLLLDHVEMRRSPAADAGITLAIVFPSETTLRAKDSKTTLILDKARARVVMDAKSSTTRETALDFEKARLADGDTGDRIEFGPLSLASKLLPEGASGWRSPIDVTLGTIKFFFTEGPVAGTIDRIAYTGQSAGPDLDTLNRLRERIAALRTQPTADPKERLDAMADLVPALLSQFSVAKGELTVGATSVRDPTGKPVLGFDQASLGGELAGLSGETARWRLKLSEDGLSLAPEILDPAEAPKHVVLEFGIENVGTKPLRAVIEAAIKAQHLPGGQPDKQAAAELLGAAAALNPGLRIYDLAVDTRDVGVNGTAEAEGSPLGPKGFKAKGNFSVRGFAALARLLGAADPLADYLPLLEQLGSPEKGPDGTPRLAFHLASVPPRWLTINGNDVSAWFAPDAQMPGEPRLLRLSRPPIQGAEVAAVQHALAAAGIKSPQTGRYDPATALAVAQFQKTNRLDVNGVVDAVIRRKLGLLPGTKGAN